MRPVQLGNGRKETTQHYESCNITIYIISVLSTPIRLHHRISFENMQVGHSPGSLAHNCWLPGCASWPVLLLQILHCRKLKGCMMKLWSKLARLAARSACKRRLGNFEPLQTHCGSTVLISSYCNMYQSPKSELPCPSCDSSCVRQFWHWPFALYRQQPLWWRCFWQLEGQPNSLLVCEVHHLGSGFDLKV